MSAAYDHLLQALWRDKHGHVYKTVSLILNPAVTLESVTTGERQTIVIGSLIYNQLERLEPTS